jgi:indole-3-glycerol phosphate synthase
MSLIKMIVKTDTILDRIIQHKERQLQLQKSQVPYTLLEQKFSLMKVNKRDSFYNSLKLADIKPKFIAEIKRASPSQGKFKTVYALKEINEAYQKSENIIAVSVLTETDYFKGSDNDLKYVSTHNKNNKAILRKDFVFDKYQILQSKLLGADAFLLIASLFDQSSLNDLVHYGQSIGVEPLVEIHNEDELYMAVNSDTRCIGVNSRDLRTFQINKSVHELARKIDSSFVRIIESGIQDADYVKYVSEFSDAILVGSYFMKSESIDDAIDSLVSASVKVTKV